MIVNNKPAVDAVSELVSAESGFELFLTCFACNTGSADAVITVYAVPAEGTPGVGTEVYYELPLMAKDTFAFTPLHLDSGESVHVKSSTGEVVFTATGQRLVK